jgi:hypothetical protein
MAWSVHQKALFSMSINFGTAKAMLQVIIRFGTHLNVTH